jgi:regulatory protein
MNDVMHVASGSLADPADSAEADPETVARAICLRQLTLGPRSRAQLAQALAKRNVPTEAATTVLDRFTDVGLIDDQAFAAGWVESRQAGRGLAKRALAHELRAKGIAAEVIEQTLDGLDPETERDAAARLVARRLKSTARLPADVRLRRLVGMLARKGYSSATAMAVVQEALASEEAHSQAGGPGQP